MSVAPAGGVSVAPALAMAAAHGSVHHAAGGWFVAVLIVIGLLYLGVRTGALQRARSAVWGFHIRRSVQRVHRRNGDYARDAAGPAAGGHDRDARLRVGPAALVPTAALVVVVLVLLLR